jgi:hypothetical protein
MGSCEDRNEYWSSMQAAKSLEQLNDSQEFKKL